MIISNKKVKDMKTVKSLNVSGLLIKDINETIENDEKENDEIV